MPHLKPPHVLFKELVVAVLPLDFLQTEITQPAVLATDSSISRLLGAYGMHPDMVMGHSLGEYGALIAAGSLTPANSGRSAIRTGSIRCMMAAVCWAWDAEPTPRS